MTRVRLPTTPVPPPTSEMGALQGPVPELCGLLVARDDSSTVAGRIQALLPRCDAVIVVDDGSQDDTVAVAREAGARVLELPAPTGFGAGLRAGMRLARELGYIGAMMPGDEDLSPADLDALARAHVQAPEALVLGVGPGQALAGKEWEQAYAEARGEEPEPYPEWRPPPVSGLPKTTIGVFEKLVDTRYAYPWGGPRVLPLQAVLRRNLKDDGVGIHLELLARSVSSGIPTVELELESAPLRPVVTCRKANLRLLAHIGPLLLKRRFVERAGMSGGYAPPTNSPLLLALAASLAVALSGCPPKQADLPVAVADCAAEHPVATWPGAGDADAALAELVAARAPVSSYLAEQGVEVTDPSLAQARKLRGVLARDGAARLRLRLMALGFTVLDYVENDGRWYLTVPPAGVAVGGEAGEAFEPPAEFDTGEQPLRPELIASLLRSVEADASVRWQDGTCAVLEELEGEAVVRRLAFEPDGDGWRVAREELVEDGVVALAAAFSDWRSLGDGATWAHVWDLEDPQRGSVVHLETRRVKLDGLTDLHFALPEFDG